MVTARVPVRTNRDDRTDAYQAMPRGGFTRMFERMLAHPKISILLNTDYRDVEGTIGYDEVVFTDPYYPIPRAKNAALYRKYQELASRTPGVHFVGRLGTYKYYNMDQVVAQALTTFAKIAGVSRTNASVPDLFRASTAEFLS